MSVPAFELPGALEATAPAEERGVARDGVRLLVADASEGTMFHARFHELPELLSARDLLVINVSATLPAALTGVRADGTSVRVHVAGRAPDLGPRWRVVELRSEDGARPAGGCSGEMLALPEGRHTITLVARYASSARLLLARFDGLGAVDELLERHGDPIRYGYVRQQWPLTAYQNAYATTPGSAEMPSAGRPFTPALLAALRARGVAVAPLVLHAGVSSPERHEPPVPEQYEVPPATAAVVNRTRAGGGA